MEYKFETAFKELVYANLEFARSLIAEVQNFDVNQKQDTLNDSYIEAIIYLMAIVEQFKELCIKCKDMSETILPGLIEEDQKKITEMMEKACKYGK